VYNRQMTNIFVGSLVLLLITGAEVRQASGQSPADIGPNTFELISYQSSGYKFKIINQKAKPPDGFEQPGFNDNDFDTSSGAFGSGGFCPLQPTVQTNWPVNSQLLARHEVTIPTETTNIRVMVSVDNDIRVFFNGKPPRRTYPSGSRIIP
jgi:hypothetical protein